MTDLVSAPKKAQLKWITGRERSYLAGIEVEVLIRRSSARALALAAAAP